MNRHCECLKTGGNILIKAVCALLLCAVLAAGCGGVSRTISGKPTAGPREGGAAAGENEEKKAVDKALDYAEEANAGSTFKVVSKKLMGCWACVAVEEAGVPADEAVGYGVYLRRLDDGTWEVATTGTGISPDELPDAPPQLFE